MYVYRKWPTKTGLVGQGIAIESGSLFKPHQGLCQA